MFGVVFCGDRRLALDRFPDPTPDRGEVVVAVKASGMCGSDLHHYRARPATSSHVIRGHEPAGEVVAAGPGVEGVVAKKGARVMIHHYHACSACEHCQTGWPQLCTTEPVQLYGSTANGAHAPYIKVHASTLVPLHDTLSFEAGAAIACGTGTAWGAFRRMKLSGRDTIAIYGQGPVGLSATYLATAMGARVIALDTEQARLAKARQFGAWKVVNPNLGDAVEEIRDITSGRGADKALETSGSDAGAADALLSASSSRC